MYLPLGKISGSLLWPIRPLLSGSSLPHQPHLTPLTFSCSSSKGPFFFLPMILCTCRSICPKCFSLTLYLANTISFIRPHPAQMFLPQGSSELPSSLGFLFLCPWHLVSGVPLPQLPRPPPLSLFILFSLLGCAPFEIRDPVCCVHCQATGS